MPNTGRPQCRPRDRHLASVLARQPGVGSVNYGGRFGWWQILLAGTRGSDVAPEQARRE